MDHATPFFESVGMIERLSDMSLRDLDLVDKDILLESDEEGDSSVLSSNQRKRMKPDINLNFDSEFQNSTAESFQPSEFKCLDDCEEVDVDEADWFGVTNKTAPFVEAALSDLEGVYAEERSMVVHQDGFISTPLHALKGLAAKFKEPVHNEIMMIKNGKGKTLVRVEIIVGAFRGVGEAYFKRLATQMASIDLLEKVKGINSTKTAELAPYAIYPGWRVKPEVTQVLLDICKKNNLKLPKYFPSTNVDDPDIPMYTIDCVLGSTTVSMGISDLSHVARKLAAFHAIEAITGKRYPMEYVAMGEACTSYKELVEMGCKPIISDTKRDWLLDETITHPESNMQRGLDQVELEELKRESLQFEFQETLEKKRAMSVTIDVGSSKRKIGVEKQTFRGRT